MISQMIRLKVQADKQQEFEGLVAQLVKDVHANEPGCVCYEVRREKNDPLAYVYFISFQDEAAMERYTNADWHTSMSPKAVACLDGDPEFIELESFY